MGLSLLTGFAPPSVSAADLAVVIDDVGYNRSRGLRAVHLPGPVTLAILPSAPHTQFLAAQASIAGKDLIIHQPMEPIPGAHVRNESDTLTRAMSSQQFDAVIERAIASVPHTLGFSNHTGSLLTSQHEPMRRFMRHLSRRGMIFLDSRTTAATVATQVASEYGVTALRRDVFLDHERNSTAIEEAFARAIRLARRNGHAVIVGHPYAVSLEFLERRLGTMPPDINLVGLATLAFKRRATLALERDPENLRISLGQ